MNDRKEDDEYKIINDEYENYEMTKLEWRKEDVDLSHGQLPVAAVDIMDIPA